MMSDLPVEIYSVETKLEFLIANATTLSDYRQVCTLIHSLGFDPAAISRQANEGQTRNRRDPSTD